MNHDIPEISPLIEKWMPEATEEEQIKATKNFRSYLRVVYGIFERLEAEGHLDEVTNDERDEDHT